MHSTSLEVLVTGIQSTHRKLWTFEETQGALALIGAFFWGGEGDPYYNYSIIYPKTLF